MASDTKTGPTISAEAGPPPGALASVQGRVFLTTLVPADLAAMRFLGAADRDGGAAPGAMWAAHISTLDPKLSGGWAVVTTAGRQRAGLVVYHAIAARYDAAILNYGMELDARGLGLGTEAVARAAAHLLDVVGFQTLFADVELTNVASRRLLHKVGFDPVTVGNTPGVEVAPDRPGQRWAMGRQQRVSGRSIINLAPVGPL